VQVSWLTRAAPFLLLCASNVFMTFAWYWLARKRDVALPIAIVASWGIAFFEYCLAVPANRIGSQVYSIGQLKTAQEAITLVVFAGFSVFFLHEPLKLTTLIGFLFIFAGAGFVFFGR
jgi:uncharacterized protein (DUF486 family)